MKLLEEFKNLLDSLKKIGIHFSSMSKIKFDSSLLKKLTALEYSSKFENDEHSLMQNLIPLIDSFFVNYMDLEKKPTEVLLRYPIKDLLILSELLSLTSSTVKFWSAATSKIMFTQI